MDVIRSDSGRVEHNSNCGENSVRGKSVSRRAEQQRLAQQRDLCYAQAGEREALLTIREGNHAEKDATLAAEFRSDLTESVMAAGA